MQYSLYYSKEAVKDRQALWESDPTAAAKLITLLDEARTDHDLLDSFNIQNFGAIPEVSSYNVKMWQEQQRKGRNLWRLKSWELEKYGILYRVVYAYDWRCHRYYVLRILKRDDFDYDNENHPGTKQIIEIYNRLDIPEITPKR